ncbi:MAG: carotenoid biosynthesis protein [Bacteroidota bacterium]
MKATKTLFSVIILGILYAVTLLGTTVFKTDLMHLTAVNLLISAFVLFFNHTRMDIRFVVYASIVFVFGWLIEYVGVETGKVFGQFFYGNNLGYKMMDIPIIIGMFWLLLNYSTSIIAERLCSRSTALNTRLPKALIAASLMVLADVFMEQVAPLYDFWYWKNQAVPLQNYTAWFAFAFAFNYLFQRLDISTENKVATWLYAFMLLLFVGLAFANPA